MKVLLLAIVAFAAMALAPAVASADPGICHNGILSDDAGQGCSDGLYASAHSGASGGICSDGILANDAGQGCADGIYDRVYGSGGNASTPVAQSSSSGGSSNSMVNPACESGGNSQVVSSNGAYWGKYQFDYGTWVAHGGSPGAYGNASEAVQDQVASRVQYDAWPNC